MITAKVRLTEPLESSRQFAATTGTGHHMLLDDATGGTGPKPIELVAVALAGCTAFDVITMLRQKYHQKITGYEVRVEADQAEQSPQVFANVRIHHIMTGYDIDSAAVEKDRAIGRKVLFGGSYGEEDHDIRYHFRGR